jgi:Domain of unknown function (DUF1707)/TM2 domain
VSCGHLRPSLRCGGTVGRVGTPEPRSIRIGTAEREQAVRALGDHFAQGRLGPEEFEERMTSAYAARTAGDLDSLFDDLPRPAPPPQPTASYPGAYPVHPPAPLHTGYRPAVPDDDPEAPYGREPMTGQPYSDRSKIVAGLLQLFLPIGIGRLYTGHAGIGIAQLILSLFGLGVLWAFIDGIVILAGRPTDSHGRPLRP